MEADRLGAGEILLTSMDCDGTRNGYDNELTSLIASHVSVPVIASGGAGNMNISMMRLQRAERTPWPPLFHYKELEIRDLKKYLWERDCRKDVGRAQSGS